MRLDRNKTAAWLTEQGYRIASATLAKKAVDGSGPPYVVWNGRAYYDTADALAWAESQTSEKINSTAQRARVK